ncbi:MAG: CHAT domain-containing protein [Salinivirgaceae bacterium]|nr:CHAT domain-containing protein [Salinivirgaceae bacterium]
MRRKLLLFILVCLTGYYATAQRSVFAACPELRPQAYSVDYAYFIDNKQNTSYEQEYKILDSLAQINLEKGNYVDYFFYKNQLTNWYFMQTEYKRAAKTLVEARKIFTKNHDSLHIENFVSYGYQADLCNYTEFNDGLSMENIFDLQLEYALAMGYDTSKIKDNPYARTLDILSRTAFYSNSPKYFYYAKLLRQQYKYLDYFGALANLDYQTYVNLKSYSDLSTSLVTAFRLNNYLLKPDLSKPEGGKARVANLYNSYALSNYYISFEEYDKAIPMLSDIDTLPPNNFTVSLIANASIKLARCYKSLNDTVAYNKQIERCITLINNKRLVKGNKVIILQNFCSLIPTTHPDLCHAYIDTLLEYSEHYKGFHSNLYYRSSAYFKQGQYSELIDVSNSNFSMDSLNQTLDFNTHLSEYRSIYYWTADLAASYYRAWQQNKQAEYFNAYEHYMLKTINLHKQSNELDYASHELSSNQLFFNNLIRDFLLAPYMEQCQFNIISNKDIIEALALSSQNTIASSIKRLHKISTEEKYEGVQLYIENLNAIQKQKVYLNSKADSLVTKDEVLYFSDLLFENTRLRNEINNNKSVESNFKLIDKTEYNLQKLQQVLTNNQAIINYFESDSLVFITVITSDSSFISFNKTTDFKKLANRFLRSIKTGNLTNDANEEISQLLLEKIKPHISKKNELIIIPNKWLNNIPFETLVYNVDSKQLMVDKFNITYNYSAQIWFNNQSKKVVYPKKKLLAIAPIFDKINSEPLTKNDTFLLANTYRGDSELSPLPYSEDEVKQISKIFKQNKSEYQSLVYEEATEENFYEAFPECSILHFATHGLTNKKYFERSGIYLYQDQNIDQDSNAYDNFLSLGEIYALNHQPDLVVLSACKTGTGKIIEGEGVMALPRGFIYAGVPNVIASLWKVHDEKTKDLMVAFYTHLLEDKVSYAEALRLAKLDCIKKGFLPMDWAGFVLIGS